MLARAAAVVLLALAAASPAVAQKPKVNKDIGCKKCDYRGAIDCVGHDEDLLTLEYEVLHCADAARCGSCHGALVVPCRNKKCKGGGTELGEGEARAAAAQEWLAKPSRVETVLDREIMRVETARFQLAADFPYLKDGKKKVTPHEYLHTLAREAEQINAWIHEDFAASDANYRSRIRMWFWGASADQNKVMTEIMGVTAPGDFKLLGMNPVFSVWSHDDHNDARPNGRYFDIHTLGNHSAAHALLSNLFLSEWIGDWRGGWFETGAAHYYEDKIHGRTVNFCMDETFTPPNLNEGYFRSPVRGEVAEGKPLFLELVNKSGMQLGEMEHALAFSVFDWLVTNHRGETLQAILRDLKKRVQPREAIAKNVGTGVANVDKAWREWVLETYPKREKKSRRGGR